jgi:arylsulfatase A-like enzyme
MGVNNTLIVVVSDHGEEFWEHGWTARPFALPGADARCFSHVEPETDRHATVAMWTLPRGGKDIKQNWSGRDLIPWKACHGSSPV